MDKVYCSECSKWKIDCPDIGANSHNVCSFYQDKEQEQKQDIIFEAGAILTSISLTKDKGLRLGFTTQELDEKERLIIQRFYQQFGYLLFKANKFQTKDIPKGYVEDKTKTPSKRLRDCLFVLWQQRNIKLDFEIFYRQQMEKIIDKLKEQMD